MNYKRGLLQATNLLIILLLLFACSTPPAPQTPAPPTATPSPADEATIMQIVRDAGKIAPPAEKEDDPKVINEEVSKDGKTRYITEKHDLSDNIDNIMYLGLNDDIIWPGNLVRGDRANDFVYEPITVQRAPITLSISLESSHSTGSSITQQVDNPKLSTVRQGISDLLKKSITDKTRVPAKVDFSYQRVYNESQMNLVLGADVKYGAGKLNTKFNWDSNTKKTKILAVYKQIYYSIDVDTPMNAADFIAPAMTAPKLSAAMPPGSRPMYIASVSYGMMALIFIETDDSEETIKAALEAEYRGGADVKMIGEMKSTDILNNSSIKIIVYGGSTANLKNLETGYDGFNKVISASSDFGPHSPGVPILYKFRHLADNTLALTTLTSQYTITRPIQIIQTIKVTLQSIEFSRSSSFLGGTPAIPILIVGFNAYNGNKVIIGDNSTRMNLQGIGEATQMVLVDNWNYGPNPKKDINNAFYINFNTDPDVNDYNNATINFKGFASYTWWGEKTAHGEKTVYLRDFFTNSGIHTFLIEGADLVVNVTVKIELVD